MQVLKYFSYEHFYVIYCKFWELDTDHDFQISREDLAHYSQCALSFQVSERCFTCNEIFHRRFQACKVDCGVLKVGLTKNGLQLGHTLLRELGGSSHRHS